MTANSPDPEIVKMTAAAYQEHMQEARTEGYLEGRDAGYQDGYEHGTMDWRCDCE